jgi:hypothetical protein
MATAKRFALTFLVVFFGVLVALVAPVLYALYFNEGSGGVAAVSVGVSELLVESFILLVVGFLCWRVWTVVRRRRSASR